MKVFLLQLRDHVSAFMLPVVVLGIIPYILLFYSNDFIIGWGLPLWTNLGVLGFGAVLLLFGLFLMAVTIRMFYQVGNGTLAPWAPTQKLVVQGIYQRTRNPMISGVAIFAFGEGFVLSSLSILTWAVIIIVANHFYFIFSEEPGLEKRFGDEYLRYKKNVPRWFPRRTPWDPSQDSEK